jgi:plastocyanin domain-containing protein
VIAVSLAALATTSCSKPGNTSPEGVGSVAQEPAGPPLVGRHVEITAGPEGYKPATIEAKQGEALVLRFTRTTKSDCLAKVVFPDRKISKDLPLNTPVEIGITPDKPGKIPFECGMAMVHGTINVTGS